MGDEVRNIESNAFASCSSLTSLTIGNRVTSIGSSAFSGCTGLTFVTIPNNVMSIGDNAFAGCTTLSSLSIGNSVTSIGYNAFSNCMDLSFLTIWSSDMSVKNNSFQNCPLENITYCCKEIGNWFSGLKSIKEVIIENQVKSIGANAFSGCTGLASITIPNGVTTIGSSAFSGCTGLTSIIIPNSVRVIGSNAFFKNTWLESVTIGSGVKTIGYGAFASCVNLTDVYCMATQVPSTDNSAFKDSYIEDVTLHVPQNSVPLYQTQTPWSQFGTFVEIPEDNNENKCAKPVINLLANGKIMVESATEGATCVTNITASNIEPLKDGEISLSTPLVVYTITSYATKEGYGDSEVATSTFRYEKKDGDMNGDGDLNIGDVVQLVNMILGN